ILKDPRLNTSDADYAAQLDLLLKINKKLTETHESINKINGAIKNMNGYIGNVSDTALASKFRKFATPVIDSLTSIKGQLYQYKASAPQDILANPVMLNDKLAGVGSAVGAADTKPTKGSVAAFQDISKRIDVQLMKMKALFDQKIPEFNRMVEDAKVPAVNIDQ
ncbi:MAG TPA: hypothetical protein PLD84_16255, partial [Chitinophagales bacterium]|nr:hypothetical protein [Chitinophagales bacterium]